ncbi:hypothetical protein B7O87_09640 [Cylindrospermopsis raciborskii CENA303]|uniref:Uncharacterized protein n=1 Tax=Cylindrospermopsis raciborskii CENA303 TaxID=1170769 RepID=A0A1X4G6G6_9CYAN|nr:hypothetical protein B7O87_09640 [Cylindrospermopsis raciborskii CENA303]
MWVCLMAWDPPQPPLKRGAFRLNVLCDNMLSRIGFPPQPPLKRGAFRLNVFYNNMLSGMGSPPNPP